MNDESRKALALRAGIALEWRDYADKSHTVSIETVRCILSALGFALRHGGGDCRQHASA